MKNILKHITGRIYKPLLQHYLSSARTFNYKGIRLLVPPEVFHPGFFYSTKFLLRYISQLPLQGKSFLELGAGSGLISLFAGREGATVTATDINPVAVDYLVKNKAANQLPLSIILSDLFSHIPPQSFDIIAINPPYYSKAPRSYAEYAWYCGTNAEYFSGLFREIGRYTHSGSVICMVLCEGSDERKIQSIAQQHGWQLNYVLTKKNLLEKNFIIRVERTAKDMPAIIPGGKINTGLFNETYIRLRKEEQRLLSDEELSRLPDIAPGHPCYKEWLIRKRSCTRLLRYLKRKPGNGNILEVGCGNGWLCGQLARIPGSKVTGIDINTTELNQAKRVFAGRSNLQFFPGDIRSGILGGRRFDTVVFAASIQYFPSLHNIIPFVLRSILSPEGEIHIIDTPFYTATAARNARLRTIAYYTEMGFPEMADYYFHHTLEEVQSFQGKILFNPRSLWHKPFKNTDPFYWFRIKDR